MAQLPETFIPDQVPEDDRNFEPIPAGIYKMQVIESHIQDTKSGSGQMLVLTLEILEGDYQNRKLWDQINIRNDNPDAQRIAQRALADLCEQLNISPLEDSEQLHFKPFMGRVTIQPDKTGQYGPQNRVRYNVNRNQGGQPAPQGRRPQQQGRPQQQRQAQRPQSSSGDKPWNKPQQQKPQDQRQAMDDEIPF